MTGWTIGNVRSVAKGFTACILTHVVSYSKWRTTPVVEEVFAEASALVAAVGDVDAAEAVAGAAVPGAASPRTRK